MDKKYVCWYKLTRSLFFESIASNQKHPKFLVEVFLQDQAPYEEKSLIKSKNSEDSDSYRMKWYDIDQFSKWISTEAHRI